MKGDDFAGMIYDLMGWDRTKRYKIIGFKIEVEGETLFVFDLTMTESFDTTRKKKKTLEEATQSGEEVKEKKITEEEKADIPVFRKTQVHIWGYC